jgi:hypothetical protein
MRLTAVKLPSVEMGSRSKLLLREFLYSCWSVHRDGEECDAGNANGKYNSGCTTDCKLCGYCGDGILDDASGEQVSLFSEHESHLSMFCELSTLGTLSSEWRTREAFFPTPRFHHHLPWNTDFDIVQCDLGYSKPHS